MVSRHSQCFLLLERIPKDANEVAILGNTIILPLTGDIFNRIKEGQLTVIDLRKADICRPDRRTRYCDSIPGFCTTIYQGLSFLARKRNCGFGNAMVLKHLSMFTKPGSTPKFTLCRARFAKYAGYAASDRIRGEGQTKIREPLLELVFPFTGGETIENIGQRQQV